MLTDIDACDCAQELYEHQKKLCTEIPYRTGESAELRSCVKVEVAVLVSVDVKQH